MLIFDQMYLKLSVRTIWQDFQSIINIIYLFIKWGIIIIFSQTMGLKMWNSVSVNLPVKLTGIDKLFV